ncbi:MAG TPA: hypothetical protein DDX14_00285 [Cyanobacteria bacterium UBA9579]|uniref:Uncharacterized protein n=1 Tax=candidate division WWE3 bacterium RBG_16_37_10 TaxID=1802610 RepID=A0A1F4UW81_UNCKA|nr:MAG: hypothetical protein A2W32_00140 [candidate division WWE3 bacterium RBG_16_37_10]HBH17384.1 hypothetical protein [Cyanobacteria bacterium UBA9579]
MNDENKYTFLAENILTMSKEFTNYIINTVDGLLNLGKDAEYIWEKTYPIISSYFIYKSLEYIHTRFLVNKYEYDKLNNTVKTVFNQKTNINSDTILNEYESLSFINSYMMEMYIGDKIVKLWGGTFSNIKLIDEICVKFYFYFDNVAVPKLTKLCLL